MLNNVEGIRAVSVIPKTFTPPIVCIMAASPYRQRGQAYADKRINLIALCIGGMSTNDATEEATEDLAELVADTIDGSTTFRLNPDAEMDQPRLYPAANNQQMLGIAVNVIARSTRG